MKNWVVAEFEFSQYQELLEPAVRAAGIILPICHPEQSEGPGFFACVEASVRAGTKPIPVTAQFVPFHHRE